MTVMTATKAAQSRDNIHKRLQDRHQALAIAEQDLSTKLLESGGEDSDDINSIRQEIAAYRTIITELEPAYQFARDEVDRLTTEEGRDAARNARDAAFKAASTMLKSRVGLASEIEETAQKLGELVSRVDQARRDAQSHLWEGTSTVERRGLNGLPGRYQPIVAAIIDRAGGAAVLDAIPQRGNDPVPSLSDVFQVEHDRLMAIRNDNTFEKELRT